MTVRKAESREADESLAITKSWSRLWSTSWVVLPPGEAAISSTSFGVALVENSETGRMEAAS